MFCYVSIGIFNRSLVQVAEQAYPLLQRRLPANRMREHRNKRAHEEVVVVGGAAPHGRAGGLNPCIVINVVIQYELCSFPIFYFHCLSKRTAQTKCGQGDIIFPCLADHYYY